MSLLSFLPLTTKTRRIHQLKPANRSLPITHLICFYIQKPTYIPPPLILHWGLLVEEALHKLGVHPYGTLTLLSLPSASTQRLNSTKKTTVCVNIQGLAKEALYEAGNFLHQKSSLVLTLALISRVLTLVRQSRLTAKVARRQIVCL